METPFCEQPRAALIALSYLKQSVTRSIHERPAVPKDLLYTVADVLPQGAAIPHMAQSHLGLPHHVFVPRVGLLLLVLIITLVCAITLMVLPASSAQITPPSRQPAIRSLFV
jgi:hypothetical protein